MKLECKTCCGKKEITVFRAGNGDKPHLDEIWTCPTCEGAGEFDTTKLPQYYVVIKKYGDPNYLKLVTTKSTYFDKAEYIQEKTDRDLSGEYYADIVRADEIKGAQND